MPMVGAVELLFCPQKSVVTKTVGAPLLIEVEDGFNLNPEGPELKFGLEKLGFAEKLNFSVAIDGIPSTQLLWEKFHASGFPIVHELFKIILFQISEFAGWS